MTASQIASLPCERVRLESGIGVAAGIILTVVTAVAVVRDEAIVIRTCERALSRLSALRAAGLDISERRNAMAASAVNRGCAEDQENRD